MLLIIYSIASSRKISLYEKMIQINTNFIPNIPGTYIVGGTVRDILLGIPPKDYDIVTLGDPAALADRIAANSNGKVIKLGKPGITIFRIISQSQAFDVAPVAGITIESDLKKRDFTINALAIDVSTGRIIDIFNGVEDLKKKKIRMISSENFKADPIRLLRAYRLGAFLNFSIDQKTGSAIKDVSFRIAESAGERIRDELIKLFNTSCSYQYILMMNETGLLTHLFPELKALKNCSQNKYHTYDVFDHTLKAYAFLENLIHAPGLILNKFEELENFLSKSKQNTLLKHAILLHDIGKPSARSVDKNGLVHFYAHEKISADMAVKINKRLRFSNQEQLYVDFIIRNHLKPLSLFTAYQKNRLSPKAITRFFLKSGDMTADLFIHTIADIYGKGIEKNTNAFVEFTNHMIHTYLNKFVPRASNPPLINGHDLINEFGLTPSPIFAKILGHVKEEQIAGNIKNRNEALSLAKKILNNPS